MSSSDHVALQMDGFPPCGEEVRRTARNMFPDGTRPRSLKTSSQDEQCVRTFGDMFADASPGAPWTRPMRTKAGEWWMSHLDAHSLRVAAIMSGIPTSELPSSKSALAAALVDRRQRLIPVAAITKWLQFPARADDEDKHDGSDNDGGETDGEGSSMGPTSPPGNEVPTAKGSIELDAALVRSLLQQMSALKSPADPEPPVETNKPIEAPLDKFLRRARDMVRNRVYIDPLTLSRSYRDHIRDKQPARGAKKLVQFGSLQIEDAEPHLRNVTHSYDVTECRQGLDFLFELYATEEAVAHRLPDMLRWNRKLWEMRWGDTPSTKVRLVKEFMFKYAAADDWATKLESDFVLLQECREFQGSRSPASQTPAPSRRRRRSRSRDRGKAPPRRDRSRSPRRDRRGAVDPRRPPGGRQYCHSRSDPAKGTCTYARCRFSHECASCGADHAAADCPAWDAAKAVSNVARRQRG